jgi:paraquat-inducible protein A
VTAAEQGLMGCHSCGLLSRPARQAHEALCPRCHSAVHWRKPYSLGRSWAYLIASIVLYIPANVLPIMKTSSLFGAQSDTIMSGVTYLWRSGSWHLALIVFIASIMVPLLKMLAIAVLLISVQWRSTWQPAQRARLYRLVEAVGRWSILDIYVVAILVTLVQLHGLASIKAGAGAIAFGAVVVLTMLSAMAFDPRLIWDPLHKAGHG